MLLDASLQPGNKRSILGQLLQKKYTFYFILFLCFVLFVWIHVGVIRVLSVNLVLVLSIRLLFLHSFKGHSIRTSFISPLLNLFQSTKIWVNHLKSIPWTFAEFRHNRIMQSPPENYFNVCRQHKEKWGLMKMTTYFSSGRNNANILFKCRV